MSEYKDFKTGALVSSSKEKGAFFPETGNKMLLKSRPPIAKDVSTD